MPDTLIVRLPNWLGDTVMAVPTLRALRRDRADARIALVGPWATMLAGQSLADILVPYPRSWTGRLARWDEVRALGAAVAVLLPNSFEAALAARYWGAARRIGFAADGRGHWLTDAIALPAPRGHQIDEYARLVEPLGIHVDDAIPRLSPPDPESTERATVRELWREVGLAGAGAPVVGIHIGAAYGRSKLWPAERIAELCRLAAERGEIPVLLGAAEDGETAARIARATGARSLVGRDRPELLSALLVEVAALVCGDTGVGHLAAALGTPVVTLFGPTDPALSAPRGPARTITHPVACSPCFYRECPIDHPCLRDIRPDEVLAALGAVLPTAVSGAAR